MLLLIFMLLLLLFDNYNCNNIFVQKCCDESEILIDNICQLTNKTEHESWIPVFYGIDVQPKNYRLVTGIPVCEKRQHWPIYHNSTDRLIMLPDGTLRHYIIHDTEIADEDLKEETLFYDYKQGFYCREKKIDSKTGVIWNLAIVCVPKVGNVWHDLDWHMRKIIDPIFHCITIISYLTVSIVHFVLPQLRDMVGNIVTTICICLTINQAADLCTIFIELHSLLSFIIADILMFASLLSAFLWLNSLGYYIWRTFRCRNVFLRITDGLKYCYYSYAIWSAAIILSTTAVFAHFLLDIQTVKAVEPSAQGTAIGWLGVALFFLPIGCTILINTYFCLSTLQMMGNMASCGRIHHKLKYCFEMFVKTAVILSIGWLSMVISWFPYDSLFYCYIFINGLQGPIILYICIFSQNRVKYLLRRVCCREKCICHCLRPDESTDGPEWGEEMMAMNR